MKPIHFTILLYAIFLFAGSKVSAQAIHKTKYSVNGLTFNYCYMEPTGKVKGIVVLLPGAGEAIKSVFSKTKLPQLLAAKGFVTIVPEIHTLLYADQYSIDVLDAVIRQGQQKFNILPYIIGGFSAGGAIATRYAEYVLAKDTSSALKGLVVVDGPLDLERLYTTAEHMIASCSGIIQKEGY
ncbi:hypothetical protein KHS38_07825 [Mucilaginibacter sp. Bleaf8]|uniref:alpha/beta hydrolase n=1 Tax=Mucilaginibacter sp. Bleaf8 TaxID=2834430 RepID=UPI001BCB656E|nr:hypothetical protein [Mucilaginibacter sp. Bleaf8]MBS7564311.1 hypothetical protein [Mucilaginibacter sp. Bleaf8]